MIRNISLLALGMILLQPVAQAEVRCSLVVGDDGNPEITYTGIGQDRLHIFPACMKRLQEEAAKKVNLDQQAIENKANAEGELIANDLVDNALKDYDVSADKNYTDMINLISASAPQQSFYTKDVLLQRDAKSCGNKTLTVKFYKNEQQIFDDITLDETNAVITTILAKMENMRYADKLVITGQADSGIETKVLGKAVEQGVLISDDSDQSLVTQQNDEGKLPTIILLCKKES